MQVSKCQTATKTVRAGLERDGQFGAVMPPLYLSSNFTFEGYDQPRKYDYTRSGNPTRDLLGEALATIENGFGGVITSSGMSAITLCLQLLKPGQVLLAPHDCYGGTYRLFHNLSLKNHFEVHFIDMTDQQQVRQALALKPTLVWVETPSNPLLRISDIAWIAEAAKSVDAILAVDNTLLSPKFQKPLDLGADLVIHSTTKFINGHSDVVGGAVICKTEALHEDLSWWANCLGITGAPFDSFLSLRGLRTLDARMRIHQENADAVVSLLQRHAAVKKVYYPGLSSHPGHEIAVRQQTNFGSLVSFELCGDVSSVQSFLEELPHFSLAESMGGVESLVAQPATMTHAAMEAEARRHAGIGDTLLRLSIGIEDKGDLVNSLEQALDRCAKQALVAVG